MSFEACLLNYRINILLNETREREWPRLFCFIKLQLLNLQLINKSRSIFSYSYFCIMFYF